MDMDKKKRQQTIRLVMTEILMVLAVICSVFILLAVVSGWRINKDLTIEQYGQVDIRSYPTGASVIIDDEPQALTLTNTSKMLTEGKHKIVLQREGFDSWEKTVTVTPGWAVRLYYPKLFLTERESETALELGDLEFMTAAPNHDSLLYAEKDSKTWKWVSVRGNSIDNRDVDLAGFVDGNISKMVWANDSERILVQTDNEWVLVNLVNPKESVKLNATYAADGEKFEKILFANSSGDRIWALKNKKIYAISLSSKEKAKSLISGVEDFAADDQELMYLGETEGDEQYIYLYHEGDKEPYRLQKVEQGVKVRMAMSSYTDGKFIAIAQNDNLQVYGANSYPTVSGGDWDGKVIVMDELGLMPDADALVSRNKEFMVFCEGEKMAVFDAELTEVYRYEYPSKEVMWVDDFMLASVVDGRLAVRDFDGTNVRELATDALANYAPTITANDRWLYYVARIDNKNVLRRERLN